MTGLLGHRPAGQALALLFYGYPVHINCIHLGRKRAKVSNESGVSE